MIAMCRMISGALNRRSPTFYEASQAGNVTVNSSFSRRLCQTLIAVRGHCILTSVLKGDCSKDDSSCWRLLVDLFELNTTRSPEVVPRVWLTQRFGIASCRGASTCQFLPVDARTERSQSSESGHCPLMLLDL